MGKAGRSMAPASSRQVSKFRTTSKRTGVLSTRKELSVKEIMSFSKVSLSLCLHFFKI